MRIVLGGERRNQAAYMRPRKSPGALIRNGHEVQAVLTHAAEEFIRPLTFASLTGRKVITDLFSSASPEGHTLQFHRAYRRGAGDRLAAGRAPPPLQLLSGSLVSGSGRRFPLDHVSGFSRPGGPRARHEYRHVEHSAVRVSSTSRRCADAGTLLWIPTRDIWPAALTVRGALAGIGQDRRSGEVKRCSSPLSEGLGWRNSSHHRRAHAGTVSTRSATFSNRSSGKMGYALAQAAIDRGARAPF